MTIAEKKTEKDFKISEDKFRYVFDYSTVGKALTSPDGKLLKINKAFADMLGYKIDEIENTNFVNLTYSEDIPASKELIRNLMSGDKIIDSLEKRYLHKSGSIVWAFVSSALFRNTDGQPEFFIASIVDITPRKIAEEKLNQLNEELEQRIKDRTLELKNSNDELVSQNTEKANRVAELIIANKELAFQNEEKTKRAEELIIANYARSMLEASLDPLVTINEDGKITDVNNALIHVTGLSREKLIDTDFSTYFTEPEKAQEGYHRAFEEGFVTDYPLILKNKNGLETEVLYNASLFKDGKGKILGVFAAARDVTKQNFINRELEAFTYSVSHDLRAPLRAINSFSQILVNDFQSQLGNQGVRYLNLIIENTKMMNQLIVDLLNISKVTQSDIKKVPIDMNKMVNSFITEYVFPQDQHKVAFTIENLHECSGDSILIRQVWVNLLENAVKYTQKKDHPIVHVSSHKENDTIVYVVEDNGAGFNPRYKDKLFKVFQRLHSSEEFKGTGIGLAIVARIIHKHDGKVWVEGEEGVGATFYFSLPDLTDSSL